MYTLDHVSVGGAYRRGQVEKKKQTLKIQHGRLLQQNLPKSGPDRDASPSAGGATTHHRVALAAPEDAGSRSRCCRCCRCLWGAAIERRWTLNADAACAGG
jgi:hypothetical protein